MLDGFSGHKACPGSNPGDGLGEGTACPAASLAVAQPHPLPLSLCPGVEGLSLDVSSLVDIRDYVNRELALRVRTDIDSQGTFFTDLNGFQVASGAWGQGTPRDRTWTGFCSRQRHRGEVRRGVPSDGKEAPSESGQGGTPSDWGPLGAQVEAWMPLTLLTLPHRCSPGGT